MVDCRRDWLHCLFTYGWPLSVGRQAPTSQQTWLFSSNGSTVVPCVFLCPQWLTSTLTLILHSHAGSGGDWSISQRRDATSSQAVVRSRRPLYSREHLSTTTTTPHLLSQNRLGLLQSSHRVYPSRILLKLPFDATGLYSEFYTLELCVTPLY